MDDDDLMQESDSEDEAEMEDNSTGLGVDFSELITLSDSEEEEVMVVEEYQVSGNLLRKFNSNY